MILREHPGGDLTAEERGRVVERFNCRHDTRRALELLRQVNALRTADGTPIYAHTSYRGFYVWPFFWKHGLRWPRQAWSGT